jgi:cytochrome c
LNTTPRLLAPALVLAAAAIAAPAQASLQLAQKHACVACHQAERKLVGPAYAEIAKRYAGQANAVAQLAESIRKGGSGKWGPVPMPAQPNLTEAEARTLAEWVLGGGK